jgi:dimethylglycine dehydrogenase
LVGFEVDATDADAIGDEPIWHRDAVVGWVTSGAFGYRLGKSLALGMVPAALAGEREFQIEVIGERRGARLLPGAPYDATGSRMRS